jgi:S-DNA-T family DNA segregation ATPase FtsK/SpoIIIE
MAKNGNNNFDGGRPSGPSARRDSGKNGQPSGNGGKRSIRRQRNPRPARPKISFDLNPAIRRDALAIAIFVLAIVAAIAVYFGGAGPVGRRLDDLLAAVFGAGRFFAAPALLILATRVAFPDKFRLGPRVTSGLALFSFSALGLLDLAEARTVEAMSYTDRLTEAGGWFGLVLGYPALALLGYWSGLLALAALVLLAVAVVFNASLKELAGRFSLLKRLHLPARRQADPNSTESGFENRPLTENEPPSIPKTAKDAADGAPPGINAAPDAEFQTAAPPKKKRQFAAMPADLLEVRYSKAQGGDIQARQFTIKKTLENFGIPVEMGDISVGPTVTQYTLKPADGVKLSRITGLSNDLALSLAAHPIRIEAPIPGKSLVGIEVPNHAIAVVSLRDLIESREFKSRASNLAFCLGKDVAGKPWVADLGRMPHLLVAGATGSGKTVCLNSIIVSLLYANTPDTLRLILIDPKRVELPIYNGIPHLLTPAITEVPKVVNALKWAIAEMDRRFTLLSKAGARDIGSYNERAAEKIPHIVIVVDELADLMVAAAAEVEAGIIRLAQMARAVGIHLVLATQRPSVDVITGLIKANIPARIAFSVASGTDSRTILDSLGAEKLVGRGDSLFQTAELSKPKRIQCCYVSDREIRRVVDFITGQLDEPVEYSDVITEKRSGMGSGGGLDGDDDELLEEARVTVVQAGKASASFLQRRLKVGYARAARLLDLLEERGIIGPGDGAKPREILVSGIRDEDGIHFTEEKEES